jgi:glycosyltransferase involved in cell wall biosynthesis
MKILQLVTSRQYRGAEVACATFSEEFIKNGHSILFIGLYTPPESPLIVKGAINLDLNIEKGNFSFKGFFKLLKIVKNEKPDILHANGSDTLKYLVMIKLFFPTKILFYRNISLVSKWIGNSFVKLIAYKLLFSRVNFITSVGRTSREDIIKTFNLNPNRVAVLNRGIVIPKSENDNEIVEDIDNYQINLKLPKKSKVLIHVGNFSQEKNHNLLINSFKIVLEQRPECILLLLGKGPLENDIKKKVNELEMSNSVYFLGVQKNISEWYKKATVLLLTSTIEGVPGVILEAASYRVPSISTNVGGVNECIVNDETGIIIDSFEPKVFSDAIIQLITNEKLQSRLGKNAFDFVSRNYDIELQSEKFIELFTTQLSSK